MSITLIPHRPTIILKDDGTLDRLMNGQTPGIFLKIERKEIPEDHKPLSPKTPVLTIAYDKSEHHIICTYYTPEFDFVQITDTYIGGYFKGSTIIVKKLLT